MIVRADCMFSFLLILASSALKKHHLFQFFPIPNGTLTSNDHQEACVMRQALVLLHHGCYIVKKINDSVFRGTRVEIKEEYGCICSVQFLCNYFLY